MGETQSVTSFTTRINDAGEEFATVTCGGTTFQVGPDATDEDIIPVAFDALVLCGTEALDGLDLTTPLTPARVDELVLASTGAVGEGGVTGSDEGHGFTISSETVWTWKRVCRANKSRMGGGTTNDRSGCALGLLAVLGELPAYLVGTVVTYTYQATVQCSDGVKTDTKDGFDSWAAANEAGEDWAATACN